MRGCLLFTFFITVFVVQGQQLMKVTLKDNPVICYARFDNCHSHVPPPEEFSKAKTNGIKSSTIEIIYGDGFPADAKTAFRYAADIWEGLISSPRPIKIQANWSNLASGVLGSAIYWSAYANFDGAQKLNVFYPVALAEKMANKELNDPNDFEIFANFSANINWYFGTNQTPNTNQYDFVTVVLHEIGHGLGFSGSFGVTSGQGTVGAFGTDVPIIYDAYVENGSGTKLLQGFPAPSSALNTQLTGNNLRFSISKTPTATAQLYAPSVFNGGSSISHLNENSYTAGTQHALMTPQIGFEEVNHNPGSLTMGILSELGWEIVSVEHNRVRNTENTTGPYTAVVKLTDDGAVQYNPANVKLNYTVNGTTFTPVTMTATGNPNEFKADFPVQTNFPFTYGYFISVGDNVGRTVLFPGKVVTVGESEVQNLIVFTIGPDTEKPIVTHVKEPYLEDTETELEIRAVISDNIGIGSASVQYKINGGSTQTQALTLISPEEDSVYTTTLNLGALEDGDEIEYTITAIDNSNSPKTTVSPSTGFHNVGVFGFAEPANSYVNNLNAATSDFFGSGFRVATPTGFSDAAIHTDHPYAEGDAFPDNELNLIYLLKVPIRVAAENPWLRFDEVVLVEPGTAGSVFGDDDFFDYAVVEGSKDSGDTWVPLTDGYDSRERSDWLSRWNSGFSGNNSTGTGNATLYHGRGINLQDAFEVGDEIIIRFRLFSDQLASGWGWAIDNIHIQDVVTSTEGNLESNVSVYPNPAKGNITIETIGANALNFNIELVNTQGKNLYTATQKAENGKMVHTISSASIPAGVLFVKISDGSRTTIKKVVKID